MRKPLLAVLAAAAFALAPLSASPAGASAPAGDYMKEAGNFLKNCDARANDAGERPEPNYVCLAFMAGLVEGYTYGAIANGNRTPYCLPRPASLAELSDMLATVIERGVKPDTPTATVFHFLLTTNFACAQEDRSQIDGEVDVAQNTEPLMPIVEPADEPSTEPLLPVVDPSDAPGVPQPEGEPAATVPDPDAPQPDLTIPVPTPSPERREAPAPEAEAEAEPLAPVVQPGAAVGPREAIGPDTAVGSQTVVGPGTATGPESAVGPRTEEVRDSAVGPIGVPLDGTPQPFAEPVIQPDPLAEAVDDPAGPLAPARPVSPQRPEGPRPVTAN